MQKLRIMSNNLWKRDKNSDAWSEQGFDCSAPARAPGFVRVIDEIQPDIIGIQEGSDLMTAEMMQGLAEKGLRYAVLWGKDTPIFYRQDKLELVDYDYFLYPAEVPGYEGEFNNGKTKSWCLGVFRSKETGKLLAFMTTHLWWKLNRPDSPYYQAHSDEAREYQISLAISKLKEYTAKYGCAGILVGDMNAIYNSLAISHALSSGMLHAHDIATDHADETCGRFFCYPSGFKEEYCGGSFDIAIDHVLVTDGIDVKCFERHYPPYYCYLSDHSPVWADIILK